MSFIGHKTYEEAVVAISNVLATMDGYRSEVQAEAF